MQEINLVFTVYPTAKPRFLRRWGKHFSKQKWEGLWRNQRGEKPSATPVGARRERETSAALPVGRESSERRLEWGWLRRRRRTNSVRSQP